MMKVDKDAINAAAEFVLRLRDQRSGGFVFAPGNSPTLMGTAYAIHTLEFLGALDRLSLDEKNAAAAFMMRHCRDDGSFRDPLFDPKEIATGSHDEAYFDGETTCFVQNALDALGASPPPQRRFPPHLLTEKGLRAEFDSYDWRDPHLNSNRVMFWMAQFAHEAERHGRRDFLKLMDVGLDWMDENQSPRTGLWSGPVEVGLSPAMAATFHYTFFYSYRSRPLLHLERIIDSCIELQRRDGLFGRGNDVGQTCLDYDALDLLAKASLMTDYRQPDVLQVFQNAIPALLALGNSDGGYANLKERWAGSRRVAAPGLYHTGLKICSCDNLESNSFSTWFRLIAYALCDQPNWLDKPERQQFQFRRLPWLGYHDVEAVRRSYSGKPASTRPIEVAIRAQDGMWLAQNYPSELTANGNRYLLPLPENSKHIGIKVKVKGHSRVDVRASYRKEGMKFFVGASSMKQELNAGENAAFFLVGDQKIDDRILLEVCAEKPIGVIEELSLFPIK